MGPITDNVMLDRMLSALIASKNQAADDVLAQALSLGNQAEKWTIVEAILKRQSVRSLCGLIEQYDSFVEPMQQHILESIRLLHHALREAGRSDNIQLRAAALRLIAIGRQGRLAYVLSENLHNSSDHVSKTATEAMVALARWIALETKRLQKGSWKTQDRVSQSEVVEPSNINAIEVRPRLEQEQTNPRVELDGISPSTNPTAIADESATYAEIMLQRPEIEAAVARAMDVHRGRHGQELLQAALLLCDWPGSKTLAILQTAKHGGQSPMVRRLQQPPASEHIEAFLLGASHGQLRSHFGIVFSHIDEAPVLDALLRKTHWLKDNQLQICMHQVSRGTWWEPGSLLHDIDRRPPEDAARVAEWLAVSGMHDVMQDERLERLLKHADGSFDARLRLLRIVSRRKRGTSVNLIKSMLNDPDERLARMAAREMIRRRPPDFENSLLQLMIAAPESVRKMVSRAIGQSGFEHFWTRFDRLDRPTRKQAGKAMLKLLPDGIARLKRRLANGPSEQKIKAIQIAQELELSESIRDELVQLCADPNPNIRSKAVSAAGEVSELPTEILIDRLINDSDARVRANAIEVMEAQPQAKLLPLLAQRARSSHNRERANAIKALLKMRVGAASVQLTHMLRDPRPEHRVSALWALRQSGWWTLLNEVGRLAKEDKSQRVRRYALSVLKVVAETARTRKLKEVG